MSRPIYTTQHELRAAFWAAHAGTYRRLYLPAGRSTRTGRQLWQRATQNQYPADVRMAWVAWVDACERNGDITEALAQRATL